MSQTINEQQNKEIVLLDSGREATLPGFDPYFGYWIKALRDGGASRNTLSTYALNLGTCIRGLGECLERSISIENIGELRPTDLKLMQETMAMSGSKPGSIALRLTTLRIFATFLRTHHGIPCDGVIISRSSASSVKETNAVTIDDRANLLEAQIQDNDLTFTWEDYRTRLLILLTGCEGLKMAEALALNIQDIRGNWANVFKGKDSRIIRLSSQTEEAIRIYLDSSPFSFNADWSAVFFWPLLFNREGNRLNVRVAQQEIKELRDRLGLNPQSTARTLRNGRILELRAKGYNDVMIMDEFGFRSRTQLVQLTKSLPPNYAAIELAAQNVQREFIPAKFAGLPQLQNPVQTSSEVALSEHSYSPTEYSGAPDSVRNDKKKRSRQNRAANVIDPDAANFIAHLYDTGRFNTATSYGAVVRIFADEFLPPRGKAVREATIGDLLAFQEERSNICISFSSKDVQQAALKRFYAFLYERNLVSTVPTLDLPPVQRPQERKYRRADINDVRKWIHNLSDRSAANPDDLDAARILAYLALLVLHGLTPGQAVGVRQSDLKNGMLEISGRSIPLNAFSNRAIGEALRFASGSPYVFPGGKIGHHLDLRTMARNIAALARKLSLPQITAREFTQAFRHGIFVHMGDAIELAKAVGLDDAQTFSRAERKSVAKKIESERHPMLSLM